eukprot:TRINITY_DN64794_c0_g1_i1.p1 TRINITY_DN64794_c0_g1~~TRINITY_DN64794_c0_g1_i1.p1  ORF type:complete len:315 (+),score=79.31 TRINITY_DN64794_c0_g1_i1:100-945(+)
MPYETVLVLGAAGAWTATFRGVSDVITQCLEWRIGYGRQGQRKRDLQEQQLQEEEEWRERSAQGGGLGEEEGDALAPEAWLPTAKFDAGRCLRFSIIGFLTGPRWQAWCILLEQWFPGRSLSAVFKKAVTTEIIYCPISYVMSIGIPAMLEYGSCAMTCGKIRQDVPPALVADFLYYFPITVWVFREVRGNSLGATTLFTGFDVVFGVLMSYLTARELACAEVSARSRGPSPRSTTERYRQLHLRRPHSRPVTPHPARPAADGAEPDPDAHGPPPDQPAGP